MKVKGQHRVESAFKHSSMYQGKWKKRSPSLLLLAFPSIPSSNRMISRVKASVKTTLFQAFLQQFLSPAEVIVFLSLLGVASCASALGTQRPRGDFFVTKDETSCSWCRVPFTTSGRFARSKTVEDHMTTFPTSTASAWPLLSV